MNYRSKNGITQLQKVAIYYCDIGGSSKSMREFINNGALSKFAQTMPDTQFYVQLVRGRHPHVKAHYKNGNVFVHDCKNKTIEQLQDKFVHVKSIWGLKAKRIGSGKITQTPSVQGRWNSLLWRFPLLNNQ
jgi:large subunit ribosomal protein L43